MAALPQKMKSPAPPSQAGPLSGQRHLPRSRSSSEQGCALATAASAAAASATGAPSDHINRRSCRCPAGRGRRARGEQGCAAPGGRPGDRPRRWILPMTALRVTPIWAAIWLQVKPLTTELRSCSTRSGVQVSIVMGNGLVFAAAISGPPTGQRPRATGAVSAAIAGASAKSVGTAPRCTHRAASALTGLQTRKL
jgi:hypothetical protein